MRRQDEVLSLYPRADQAFRRILLDLAGDLTPVHDSGDVETLLLGNLGSQEPWTRAVASQAYSSFATFWVPARARIAAPTAGTWTALHLVEGRPDAGPPDEATLARQATLHRALLYTLEPTTRALVEALPSFEGGQRTLALLCLAQLPTPAVVEALQGLARGAGSWDAAQALAACGTRAAHEACVARLSGETETAPQALAGLRSLGAGTDPAVAARAAGLIDRALDGGQDQLVAASLALGGQVGLDVERVAEALAGRANPWTMCHLLIALARAGSGLSTAVRVYSSSTVPLLKTLAVRAAGGIPTDPAREFLLAVAAQGEGNAQALSLELLARRESPVESQLLKRLLGSPHWRVRLNAALLMATEDPERAFPVLLALLTSPVDVERASGAFALAYLQNAERILIHLLDDPSPMVRAEAVSSLARHAGARPVRALARVAVTAEPALALRALAALAWSAGEGIAEVVSQLTGAASERADPRWRGQFFRTIGSLAAGAMVQPAGLFAAGLTASDPEEVVGCLDGAIVAGVLAEPAGGVKAPCVDDPRVQARVGLAELVAGRLDGAARLARLLSAGPAGRAPALGALWELVKLTPWLGRSPRLSALEKALVPALKQPDYLAFSSRQLDLSVPPAGVTCPVEADPAPTPSARLKPRLPTQAMAVVDLPRPRSKVSAVGRTGYYAPLPTSRRLPLAAAALLGLVAVGWLWHGDRPAAPRPAPPPVKLDPAIRLAVGSVSTGSKKTPGSRLSVGPGETFKVDPGDRAVLTGPYPGPRLEIYPGEVQVTSCRSRANDQLGCDLNVKVKEGLYRVDARPGASSVEMDALGQKLTSRGAHFTVQLEPEGGRVQVRSGTVQLAPPVARDVGPGQEVTWGQGIRSGSIDPTPGPE